MNIQQPNNFMKPSVAGYPNNTPVIAGTEITTDDSGRFNLNALHRASGLGVSKAPAQWLRSKQAQELVAEVEKQTVQICIVSIEGRNGGTFAHELLAISYAGWISPAFQLQVNQVFLDYRTGKLAQPDPMAVLNDPASMRSLLLTYSEKVLDLEQQIEISKPKLQAFDRLVVADGSLNLTEAAKALQQQPKKFNQHLSSLRWIYKRTGGKQWLGYQDKVQQGLVEHKITTVTLADGVEKICEQVRITPKGLTKLAQALSVGGAQ